MSNLRRAHDTSLLGTTWRAAWELVGVCTVQPREVMYGGRMTTEETKREIAHLLSLKEGLVLQLHDVNAALDRYKVKCPTCRCRILPEETCRCCAEPACDPGDPDL